MADRLADVVLRENVSSLVCYQILAHSGGEERLSPIESVILLPRRQLKIFLKMPSKWLAWALPISKEEHKVNAADIAEVELGASPFDEQVLIHHRPKTGLEGKLCFQVKHRNS